MTRTEQGHWMTQSLLLGGGGGGMTPGARGCGPGGYGAGIIMPPGPGIRAGDEGTPQNPGGGAGPIMPGGGWNPGPGAEEEEESGSVVT